MARSDRTRPARILGVDLARALAIVGMFAVHVGPTDVGGPAGRLYAAPHGRASILFVLLAGVGVSLLAGSRRSTPTDARLALLWRAALLLPLGLALQLLEHNALVILQNYALLFVLAAAVLTQSDRTLLRLSASSAVLGPIAHLYGTMTAPAVFERNGVEWTDSAAEIAHGLVLSGPYPLIVWAAPLLFGMWIGRRDLRSRSVRLRFLVGGAATAVGAFAVSSTLEAIVGPPSLAGEFSQLVVQAPHSQMPLWVIGATGSAAFLLGGALIVADFAARAVWPLVAAGQQALTLYVAHLLALHVAPDTLRSDDVGGAVVILVGFAVVAVFAAVAWRAVFARGPLEALLRPPWQVITRRQRG